MSYASHRESWEERFERVVETIETLWLTWPYQFTNTLIWHRTPGVAYSMVCQVTRHLELDGAVVHTNPGSLPKLFSLTVAADKRGPKKCARCPRTDCKWNSRLSRWECPDHRTRDQ